MPSDTIVKVDPKLLKIKLVSPVLEILADAILEKASEFIVQNDISDTGDLLKSGASKQISDDEVSVTFGGGPVQVSYAVYIEYGTSPHMPPVEPLKKWAKRKLRLNEKKAQSAAWAIAVKIKKEGTEPNPYLRPAIDYVMANANAIIKENLPKYKLQ
ncbi:hypothetical protein KAR91_44475 [Candidatus Pacearchaeota archaeon]|nr:hypothetical protein [Candidatus Pacearchaeota archaeon]